MAELQSELVEELEIFLLRFHHLLVPLVNDSAFVAMTATVRQNAWEHRRTHREIQWLGAIGPSVMRQVFRNLSSLHREMTS